MAIVGPMPWRLLLFVVRHRLPHGHALAGVVLVALLLTAIGTLPALVTPRRPCTLTVGEEPLAAQTAPVLVHVAVRARGQLVAAAERLDGTGHPAPARFALACGDYDVTVEGDDGGGVGRLATATVHLDRDQAIRLDLR